MNVFWVLWWGFFVWGFSFFKKSEWKTYTNNDLFLPLHEHISSNQGSYVPAFLIRQKPLFRENSLQNSIVATQGGLVRITNLSDLVKGCAEDTTPVHVVHSCHPLWLRISDYLLTKEVLA